MVMMLDGRPGGGYPGRPSSRLEVRSALAGSGFLGLPRRDLGGEVLVAQAHVRHLTLVGTDEVRDTLAEVEVDERCECRVRPRAPERSRR